MRTNAFPPPVLLAAFALGLLLLSPLLGGEPIALGELLDSGSPSHRIVFGLRLPRLLVTLIAGGSLAVLGASYQILFQNPLAEPYILGVSNAVVLGVAVAEIVFGISAFSAGGVGIGFAAAMTVTLMILAVFWWRAGYQIHRVVLFGLGLQFVLSSALFLILSYHAQQMGGGSLRWLFGQIPWLSLEQAGIFAAVSLPFLAGALVLSRGLDALTLGDSVALSLGFSPRRIRTGAIAATSAWISVLVAFTGAIGFVGLVVPHGVRLVFRPERTRTLLLWCLVWGGAFLAAADVVSRILLPPFEFPIGILTALTGGPVFLYLLARRRT